jgi:hypothetical protein
MCIGEVRPQGTVDPHPGEADLHRSILNDAATTLQPTAVWWLLGGGKRGENVGDVRAPRPRPRAISSAPVAPGGMAGAVESSVRGLTDRKEVFGMRTLVALLLLSVLGVACPDCRAGECIWSNERNLEILTQWAGIPLRVNGSDWIEVSGALNCLRNNRLNYWKWAGPVAGQYFRNLHKSPLRGQVIQACAPYLTAAPSANASNNADFSRAAAETLAMYGVKRVGDHDVFAIMVHRSTNCYLPYYAIASLGDPRSLSLLKARYDSLRSGSLSIGARGEKIQIVNCLYHLPGDSVLSFVSAIASAELDSAVVARARHVLEAR